MSGADTWPLMLWTDRAQVGKIPMRSVLWDCMCAARRECWSPAFEARWLAQRASAFLGSPPPPDHTPPSARSTSSASSPVATPSAARSAAVAAHRCAFTPFYFALTVGARHSGGPPLLRTDPPKESLWSIGAQQRPSPASTGSNRQSKVEGPPPPPPAPIHRRQPRRRQPRRRQPATPPPAPLPFTAPQEPAGARAPRRLTRSHLRVCRSLQEPTARPRRQPERSPSTGGAEGSPSAPPPLRRSASDHLPPLSRAAPV